MRYGDEEVDKWLADVDSTIHMDYYLFSGRTVRRRIEKLLREHKQEIFSPNAFYDLAMKELSDRYKRKTNLNYLDSDSGNFRDLICAA